MRKILERCPTCGGDLAITEVSCQRCDTTVRSRYSPCPFCRLSDDQITFLLLFVENRGNLTELEKHLGVSYPTVRNKLDEVIQIVRGASPAAGEADRRRRPSSSTESVPSGEEERTSTHASPPDDGGRWSAERRRILERVAAKEIDAAAALAQLRALEDENG